MPEHGGQARPSGALSLKVLRSVDTFDQIAAMASYPACELRARDVAFWGLPRRGLSVAVNGWRASNARNLWRGARRVGAARMLGLPTFYGNLYLTVIRADGEVAELGLASMRMVTTAGVQFLVDAFQGIVEPEIMKFHGIGTGGTAEATADTALVTELTTQYAPDSTRATGTTIEGGSANVYRTVGTNTVDTNAAITEHGVLTQAATGGGVLFDRSLFSVVNLGNGDSLQSTYDFTITAGG